MKRCIATVSLSGALEDKLQAVAAANFDGVEIYENDLVNSGASPRAIQALAQSLGSALTCFSHSATWKACQTTCSAAIWIVLNANSTSWPSSEPR
jgi:4-hydroxyphenylpyruvate dioxygenase